MPLAVFAPLLLSLMYEYILDRKPMNSVIGMPDTNHLFICLIIKFTIFKVITVIKFISITPKVLIYITGFDFIT